MLTRAPAYALLGAFRLWQLLVSPSYGQTCRFYPSCSTYGVQAVRAHGALRGGGLTLWRVLRCNPWNPGGVDLVPLHDGTTNTAQEPLCPDDSSRPDEPAPPARRAA